MNSKIIACVLTAILFVEFSVIDDNIRACLMQSKDYKYMFKQFCAKASVKDNVNDLRLWQNINESYVIIDIAAGDKCIGVQFEQRQ